MSAILTLLAANLPLIFGVIYAILNLVVALRPKSAGVIGKILQVLAFLQPKNSEGTVKAPGTPAAPVIAPIMQGKK
jgi:hypothetical protein